MIFIRSIFLWILPLFPYLFNTVPKYLTPKRCSFSAPNVHYAYNNCKKASITTDAFESIKAQRMPPNGARSATTSMLIDHYISAFIKSYSDDSINTNYVTQINNNCVPLHTHRAQSMTMITSGAAFLQQIGSCKLCLAA